MLTFAKRWWQEQTGGEETLLDGDTPAWAVSLVIHVVVLTAMALIGVQKIDPRSKAIAILASVAPIEDDFLIPPEMVVAPEESSAAASDAENL